MLRELLMARKAIGRVQSWREIIDSLPLDEFRLLWLVCDREPPE